jgi:hypothetical protein
MGRLPGKPPDEQQERERQRKPPEAGGDRPDVGKTDQPRAEGKGHVAQEQRWKGERMGFGSMAHERRLTASLGRN